MTNHLSDLQTSAEIYKRIAQGKQISIDEGLRYTGVKKKWICIVLDFLTAHDFTPESVELMKKEVGFTLFAPMGKMKIAAPMPMP